MNTCLGASLGTGFFTALATPVQASDINGVYSSLSMNQYLQILIAALILGGIFIAVAYVIGKRNTQRSKVNPVTKTLAMILAIIYLIVGTVLLIIDFIVLVEPHVQTDMLTYIVQTFQYYFPEMVFGVIVTGAAGLLLYLVGFYIMIFVSDSGKIEKVDESYHIQAASEVDNDASTGNTKYFKLTFHVTSWDSKEPLSDGKIHLETKDGTLMMIKYTDYMGEVDFGKLRGIEEDYYAYVEGDRDRQEYRFVTIT